MKLFLASGGAAVPQIAQLGVGPDSRVLFVTTAGEPEAGADEFQGNDRRQFHALGVELRDFTITGIDAGSLATALDWADVVWAAGGNTYFLLQEVNRSGFRNLLGPFLERGGVYGGSSAGALVAGPDIEVVGELDQAGAAPDLESTTGLGLVDVCVMPHAEYPDFAVAYDRSRARFGEQYRLVFITDPEALLVDGDRVEVVGVPATGSPR